VPQTPFLLLGLTDELTKSGKELAYFVEELAYSLKE